MSLGLNLLSLMTLGVGFEGFDEFGGCFLVRVLTSGVRLMSLGAFDEFGCAFGAGAWR